MPIHDRERMRQILDFAGMGNDRLHPTDIDGLWEWHDKVYVIIEMKYGANILPMGQRICYETMTRDLSARGKPVIVIVGEHDVEDCRCDVNCGESLVREIFLWNERRWRPPTKRVTVNECIDAFMSAFGEGIGWREGLRQR